MLPFFATHPTLPHEDAHERVSLSKDFGIGYHSTEGSVCRTKRLEMGLDMELSVEKRHYKRLAAELRMALVSGTDEEALSAIKELVPLRSYATPKELVDFLERACVWASREVVDAIIADLGPIPYCGWALALALRCDREDIAYDLKARRVNLLEDPEIPESLPERSLLIHDLTRGDMTGSSPKLFEDPQGRSVTSEIFRTFGPSEELVGADYSRGTDARRSCELVAKLANDQSFIPVVFDDIFRAALACASRAHAYPASYVPGTAESCIELADALLELWRQHLGGTERIPELLGRMVVPNQDERLIVWICEKVPEVFYDRLCSQSWLKKNVGLVRRMVAHLTPGTEYQNGVLLSVLAGGACFDQLEDLLGWQNTYTPANLDRAIDAASEAGHAEIAAWLLTLRQDLSDTAKSVEDAKAEEEPEQKEAPQDDEGDLGDLSDLLL